MNDNSMKDSNESIGEAMMNAAAGTEAEQKFRPRIHRQMKEPKQNVDAAQDKKISELTNDLQRTRADFENFRRQTEQQREQYGTVMKLATVKKMLPLLDDIDRAVAANPDTLGPVSKNIDKTLRDLGLARIPAEPGMDFSPSIHDAVMVEGDGDIEKIAEELRAGYYYDGEVLRPAMVKVVKQ